MTVPVDLTYAKKISFGTGVANEDCILFFNSGSQLYLNSGLLLYNNFSATGFRFSSNFAEFKIGENGVFGLQTNLSYEEGSVIFENNATLGFAAGVDLNGSIIPEDQYNVVTLP